MSQSTAGLPYGVLPLVRPIGRFRRWFPAVLYLLALWPLTVQPRHSANVLSRYLTIEAIVERGTLAIERTPLYHMGPPVDMVRFGNHFYSDKPPVLAALASPIYGVLVFMDVRFTGSEMQYAFDNLALTWLTAGISSALTLVWLRRMLQGLPIRPLVADALTIGFGVGSQLLTYAVTFNNHSVAAALMTGAMASTFVEAPAGKANGSRLIAGLMAGLASTIDLPAGGVFLGGLAVVQAVRVRSIPWAYLTGAIGPLFLHAGLQSLVTGSPLPAEMYPAAFDYPGSYWNRPEMIWHEHGPRWRFGLELLVGPRGWLTVTPVLVFGLIGLGMALARKNDPLQPMARVVVVSLLVLLGYYTWGVRRTDFGGDSFGTRHLLAITPPCFLFAAVALERLRGKAVPVLFVGAMMVGGVYAVVGEKNPWKPIEEVRKTNPWLQKVQWLVIYPRSQNLENPGMTR
jgi:hypothetical protein